MRLVLEIKAVQDGVTGLPYQMLITESTIVAQDDAADCVTELGG